jgi:CRP/FNR family transcriptional regulator, cyclic AMP receptor protein
MVTVSVEIPDAFVAQLHKEGRSVRFAPGVPILRQGDSPDYVVLLLKGRVKVTLDQANGKPLLLTVLERVGTLGASGVLGARKRSCTVTAMSLCSGRLIVAGRFLHLVTESKVAEELLRQALLRVEEGNAWHASTVASTADLKVCRALLRFAHPRSDGLQEVELIHEDIGGAVGISRQMVDIELRWLREAGVVRTEHRRVVILNWSRLTFLAEKGRR